MVSRARRLEALLAELRTAERMTAGELALRLGVSTRSIREYVREINALAARPVVLSDQGGYSVDARALHDGQAPVNDDAPSYRDVEQRLYYIVRRMVADPEGADVYELGDELVVSPSTIEADLARVRELLRSHRLTMERRGGWARILGPERQQRRLVRDLLLNTRQGLLAGSPLEAGTAVYETRIRALRARARTVLRDTGLEVNEYALRTLLLNAAVAAERIAVGRALPETTSPATTSPQAHTDDRPGPDRVVQAAREATERIGEAIGDLFGVALPEQEKRAFLELLLTRSRAAGQPGAPRTVIDKEAQAITHDSLREISARFKLDLYNESAMTGIALHIQGLIQRARIGELHSEAPLGESFRRRHPLIHELALCLAREIEVRAGIRVEGGEVDFLAFHIGNQVLEQMEQGPPVTITLVIPEHGTFSQTLEREVVGALPPQAVVTETVRDLTYDWSDLVSDLIVSVVDLVPPPAAPLVRISPFFTDADKRCIADAVREERRRAERESLRTNIVSLLDPGLFLRVPSTTRDDCLALQAGLLHERGFVSERFIDDVFEREQRSSTALGPLFALPHTMGMKAHKTAISVLVSDTPIDWDGTGDAAVRLVLMFAISPDGRVIFRDVLDKLIELLSTPASVRRLLSRGSSHTEFVHELLDLVGD